MKCGIIRRSRGEKLYVDWIYAGHSEEFCATTFGSFSKGVDGVWRWVCDQECTLTIYNSQTERHEAEAA